MFCICVCLCSTCLLGACGGQKRVLDFLERGREIIMGGLIPLAAAAAAGSLLNAAHPCTDMRTLGSVQEKSAEG